MHFSFIPNRKHSPESKGQNFGTGKHLNLSVRGPGENCSSEGDKIGFGE